MKGDMMGALSYVAGMSWAVPAFFLGRVSVWRRMRKEIQALRADSIIRYCLATECQEHNGGKDPCPNKASSN